MKKTLKIMLKKKSMKIFLTLIIVLTVLALKEYITAKNKPSIDDEIIKDRKFHTVNDL